MVSLAFLGCMVMPEVEEGSGHVIRAPKPKSGFMMVVGSDGKVSVRSGLHREIPVVPFVLSQALVDMSPLQWTEFTTVSSEVPPSPGPLQKVRGRAPPFRGLC